MTPVVMFPGTRSRPGVSLITLSMAIIAVWEGHHEGTHGVVRSVHVESCLAQRSALQ